MPGLFYPLEWSCADDDETTRDNEQRSALISSPKDGEGVLGETSPFVHAQRPRRDVAWLWLLGTSFVGATVWAIALQFYGNPSFDSLISNKSLQDPANCPLTPLTGAPRRRGLLAHTDNIFQFEAWFQHNIGWLLLGAAAVLAASVVIGTGVLRLFEAKAEGTVKVIAATQLALPLCAAVYLFLAGSSGLGTTLLVLGVANMVCAGLWRPKLPLLARLVSLACSIVADNPNLFWVSVLTQAAITATSILFFYAFSVSQRIGGLAHNPVALPPDASSICIHILTKQPTPCCVWQPSGLGVLFTVPSLLVQMWITSFLIEAQNFVIAGAVGQWYFAPVSSASCLGNVARSGKHMASSLGTLALGSLALYFVRILRTFTYINDRRLTWKNPISYICGVFCCLYFAVSCLVTPCVDTITKYATHRAAISGYGFSHANSAMYNTFRHSRLNYVGIGWLPPFILRFSSVTLAITGSLLAASYTTTAGGGGTFLDAMATVLLKAEVPLVVIMFSLSLAAPLLLGIIDSFYVCFALDLEQQTCSKRVVHNLFTHVPPIGPIWDDDRNTVDGIVPGVPATHQSELSASGGPQYGPPPVQRV